MHEHSYKFNHLRNENTSFSIFLYYNFPSKQLFSVSASRRGKWRKVKKNEYFTNCTPLSVLSITLNNITYYRGSCDYLQVFIEHRLKKVYVFKHLYSY